MEAKIFLNQPLTQDRYGLHFEKGEAYTDNQYLINKLQAKGVKVEIIEEEKKEKTIDEMTVAELKVYATTNNIEIPSDVKNKADIVEFIKNYKKDDGSNENNPGEPGENESDKNPETENPGEPGETNPDTTGQENQ